uniref:Uncharacterized protein n=1 Tax=viral metagenome TaxID=1070528 RepID=A0A6C0BSJ6_9ZZZZ
MSSLEQNISNLNKYLADENTVLKENIKLQRDINSIEGEIDRSKLNYNRLSKIMFYLTIIIILLFSYTVEFDLMYPFKSLSNFLSGSIERQSGLILIMGIILFIILYFTKIAYTKLVTTVIAAGLLYTFFLKILGMDLMGTPLFVLFIFMYFIFDL